MRKQYMDFVPAKVQTKPAKKKVVRRVMKTTSLVESAPKAQPQVTSKVGFTGEKKPALGKVENLNTRFVKADVPKRPLNRAPHFTTGKTGVAAVKAQKVGLKNVTPVKPVEKTVEKSKKMNNAKATYQAPKSPFISQGKVEKRPLSAKNVYPEKKPKVVKEEPKGPVTIISKPEKQAHAGMIIAIVLTIILGGAAGTVAFLLLPK